MRLILEHWLYFSFLTNKRQYLDTSHIQIKKKEMHRQMHTIDFSILPLIYSWEVSTNQPNCKSQKSTRMVNKLSVINLYNTGWMFGIYVKEAGRRLLFLTSDPVPFETCICSNVEISFSNICHDPENEFLTNLSISIWMFWIDKIDLEFG